MKNHFHQYIGFAETHSFLKFLWLAYVENPIEIKKHKFGNKEIMKTVQ